MNNQDGSLRSIRPFGAVRSGAIAWRGAVVATARAAQRGFHAAIPFIMVGPWHRKDLAPLQFGNQRS
jgi:hypothetical protein